VSLEDFLGLETGGGLTRAPSNPRTKEGRDGEEGEEEN
jgi:hypothetical protein